MPKKFILSIFIFEKKDINSIKSGKGGNNVELEASKENSIIDGNNSNSKLVLISVPNYIQFLLRQLTCTHTKHILYPR